MLYSAEEKKFIKLNYPSKGAKYCAERLNRTVKGIGALAEKLKIRSLSRGERVNFTQFANIKNETCAYILGLLWADGSIVKNYKYNYTVKTSNVISDAEYFLSVFRKTGNWKYFVQNRELPRQNLGTVYSSGKDFWQFLMDNDYSSKHKSADKILSKIPKKYHAAWFLGLFDGDGCLSMSSRSCSFIISGPYDQDWTYVSNFLKSLNLNPKIYKYISKKVNSRGSRIQITGRKNCFKVLNFLYTHSKGLGLKRKRDIFDKLEALV
jgi:hypothetical protein